MSRHFLLAVVFVVAVVLCVANTARAELLWGSNAPTGLVESFFITVDRQAGLYGALLTPTHSSNLTGTEIKNHIYHSGLLYTITLSALQIAVNEQLLDYVSLKVGSGLSVTELRINNVVTNISNVAQSNGEITYYLSSFFAEQSETFNVLEFALSSSGAGHFTLGFAFKSDNTGSTPEPATMLILGLGIVGLGFVRRRMM